MLGEVLIFLSRRLDGYLSARLGVVPGEPDQAKVVLPDGEKSDPVEFQLGAVTALLVNLELDKVQRPPDLFHQSLPNGKVARVSPEIRINLYILFVARFKQYEQGLSYLSLIIQYFQGHRTLDHTNAPELDKRIDQLTLELTTLSFAEQGEIWSSLRTGYLPSVLYRVGTIVFQDEDAIGAPEITEETLITTA
jgi:Pvc16 N-terminal domain